VLLQNAQLEYPAEEDKLRTAVAVLESHILGLVGCISSSALAHQDMMLMSLSEPSQRILMASHALAHRWRVQVMVEPPPPCLDNSPVASSRDLSLVASFNAIDI
jgi:hypothetical protein